MKTMTDEERFLKLMDERSSMLPEEGVDMEAESLGKPRPDNTQIPQANPNQPTAGTGLSAAGDAAVAGGAATANPYVAAAGLALKAVGQVDDAKRAGEQAKIDAYNKKIMAARSAVHNMFT